MTKADAVKRFKREYRKLYIERADYWKAHLAWSEFTDYLNREGEITDKQFQNWSTPFPYGKSLKPSREQLEMEVYNETD